jgi:NitT/TauT family transport system ATP-binding protein
MVPSLTPLLSLRDVTIQYKTPSHQVTATYRVSFDIFNSDRFILLGPSGCGKSTLLKAVGGFVKPSAGAITFRGAPVREPFHDRMVVFQEFDQLLPWKTVLQNVMFPLRACGLFTKRVARDRAMRWIKKVKLEEFSDAYPHALSGGMKQRVAIARALAMEPAMLLMDEPFASLDALTRRQMQEELLDLWRDTRVTLLFVTHSLEEATTIGSRILVLTPHPGRVRGEFTVPQEQTTQSLREVEELRANLHSLLVEASMERSA